MFRKGLSNGVSKRIGKAKNIYFDSNDEMYNESELSDTCLLNGGNEMNYENAGVPAHKHLTKIQLKPSEMERQKMREMASLQKK